MPNMRIFRLLLAKLVPPAALLLMLTPWVASTQSPTGSTGRLVPVVVVLVDSLPSGGGDGAVIIRQVRGSPQDRILMTPSSATGRQLSAAVFTLTTLWAARGSATVDETIRVPVREGPAAWIETVERVSEGVVRRLRKQTPRYHPEHGIVRSRQVFVRPGTVLLRAGKQMPTS